MVRRHARRNWSRRGNAAWRPGYPHCHSPHARQRPQASSPVVPHGPLRVAFKHVSATRWDGSHPNGRALGDWRAPIRATVFPRFGVKPLSHCVTPLSAARREGRGKDPYPWPRREPLAALTNRRPSRHNGLCINSKGAQVGPLAEYKSRYRAGSSYPAPANRQDFSSLCVLMHGPTPFPGVRYAQHSRHRSQRQPPVLESKE